MIGDVEAALSDSDGQVRRQGLRLSETMPESESVQRLLVSRLPGLLEDEDPKVVFQAVLTAGLLENPEVLTLPLTALAQRQSESKWLMKAILATSAHFPSVVLTELLIGVAGTEVKANSALANLVTQLSVVAGSGRNPDDLLTLLRVLHSEVGRLDDSWYAVCLRGIVEGLDLMDGEPLQISSARPILRQWVDHESPALRVGARELARHLLLPDYLERAPAEVMDETLPQAIREAALSVLRLVPWSVAAPVLGEILRAPVAQSMKSIAIRILGSFQESAALEMLLDQWDSLSSAMRRQTQDTILRRPDWTLGFLNAVEQERVAGPISLA